MRFVIRVLIVITGLLLNIFITGNDISGQEKEYVFDSLEVTEMRVVIEEFEHLKGENELLWININDLKEVDNRNQKLISLKDSIIFNKDRIIDFMDRQLREFEAIPVKVGGGYKWYDYILGVMLVVGGYWIGSGVK